MNTDSPTHAAAPADASTADERLLHAVLALGDATPRPGSPRQFLFTAALFLILGAAWWGVDTVLHIAAAVALHELGHVFAMRLCGYKNVRMLFVPLFGGLATGEPRELDATRNTIVALAGPVVGLLTAVAAGFAAVLLPAPEVWLNYAMIALFLNGFNLLPLYPLDGGQVANETLFSRFPGVELVFRLAAIAGLGWLAYALEAWLLGVLPVYLLLTAQASYRRARMVRQARRDATLREGALDLDAVRRLRDMVVTLFEKLPREKYEPAMPGHVHALWLEIRKRRAGLRATLGLLAAYALCLAAVFFIWGFLHAVKTGLGLS